MSKQPRKFIETLFTDTHGLPDGKYTTLNPGGFPHRPAVEFRNGQWPTLHEWEVSYLRPLPEGTRLLQPGEAAVSEIALRGFIEKYEKAKHVFDKEILIEDFLTKLAQMGEGKL